MKTRLVGGIAIVLAACFAAGACVSTGYHQTVSMGTPAVVRPDGWDQPFYEDLAPYGRWTYVAGPGWVWSPYNVRADWRPYRLGHWVYTDYGWTWASDESWGWVVYHYGRWHFDAARGWVWVPGTEWGPAWVAWHEGGGYVGWAPLPWQVRFRADVGLEWGGVSLSIEPSWWSFVGVRHLVNPALPTHILPVSRNVTLIQVTRNVTHYTYVDNRIVNQGVQVERIGRALGRAIPRYRLVDDDTSGAPRGGKVRGEEFVVFRPSPARGRNSHDRPGPPGQEVRDRAQEIRRAAEQAGENLSPGGARSEPAPVPSTGQPGGDSATSSARPETTSTPPAAKPGSKTGWARKMQERLERMQNPRSAPPETAAAPPAAPPATAPADNTDRSSAPPERPAETRPSGPDRAEQTSTQPRPGHPAPPDRPAMAPPARTQPAKPQEAKDKANDARETVPKGRKPKKDAPKPESSDSEESKSQKAGRAKAAN